MNGTDQTVETALFALGAIGTEESVNALSSLSRHLSKRSHRQMAYKQISHQYQQPWYDLKRDNFFYPAQINIYKGNR